jgi:hypothetical protein
MAKEYDFIEYYVTINLHPERGVTANIPVLGTGDSGFESRRSERSEERKISK